MLTLMSSDDENSGPEIDVAPCVASAPLVELLETTAAEIRTLRELSPQSPVLPAYERLFARLHDALLDAERREVWVSTAVAAERLGFSTSTIQAWCKKDAAERPFRARKIKGSWRIDASSLPRPQKAA